MLFSSPACWQKQQLSGVVLHGQALELLPSPQDTIKGWPCKGNLFLSLQLHKTEPKQPWPQRKDPEAYSCRERNDCLFQSVFSCLVFSRGVKNHLVF